MKKLRKTLILPNFLREELAKPKGKLYRSLNPEKKVIENLIKLKPVITITVGDVCTASIISQGYYPNIIIIDNKTKRKQIDEYYKDINTFNDKINEKYVERTTIVNPPATIQAGCWVTIERVIKESLLRKKYIQVFIDGEEDLLVFPCVVGAPLGSAILYGQPDQGIVEIIVNDDVKNNFLTLISQFQEV